MKQNMENKEKNISKEEGLKLVHQLLDFHKDCFVFGCPGIDFVICNDIDTLLAIRNGIDLRIEELTKN